MKNTILICSTIVLLFSACCGSNCKTNCTTSKCDTGKCMSKDTSKIVKPDTTKK